MGGVPAAMLTLPSAPRSRAVVAGRYRIATLLGFIGLIGAMEAGGIASPDGALVFLAGWSVAAALGQLGLSRARGPRAANRLHAALTALDITLLTVVHLTYGGGWWLGASFYFLVAIYIYASMPRRVARGLTAYVIVAYLALLALQQAPVARRASYLGVHSLADRGRLAVTVGAFGAISLLIGALVLHVFVGAVVRERRAYRLLLESAEDMIFTFDPQGRFVALNDFALRQSGYAREEILGQSFLPFIVADDQERTRAYFAAAMQGVPQHYEIRYRRRDGSLRWISCTNTPIRDGRRVTGVLAIIRDVTDRREAEAERERSLSVLQATFDSTTDGILVVDGARRVVSYNARFALLWRLPEAAPAGGCDRQLLEAALPSVADPAGFQRRVEEIYAAPDAECVDVLNLRDGRVFERYSRPQWIAGRPAGRVWSFRDVTVQVRAEISLRDSEHRYRMVLEQSTDGVVLFDDDGRIGTVNPAFAQMLGWSQDELVGRSIADTVEDGELDETPVRYDLLRRGETLRRVRRFRRRDGATLAVEVVSKMLPTGQFLALVRDITEREALESQLRQAQKMEAVGQLAGGVAHDFNNLLTVIVANAELALGDLPPDASARGELEEIRRASTRAATLTRQLLAFSRRQPMQTSVLDPVPLLGELNKLLARLITPQIELRLEIQPDLWRVRADSGQLEQTIVNLTVNSRDAMPEGGTLLLRARNETLSSPLSHEHGAVPSGEYVCFELRDTGIGMSPQVQARIFEPFFTTKGPGKGTGLGLSTVYGIVKQHGGHILVHSRPAQGTLVRVLLPRALEEAATEDSSVPRSSLRRSLQGTILLVDDEHAVLQAVRSILERSGYTVLWARTPDEALATEAAFRDEIDALVTDVVMPRMNGRILAEAIAERRADIGIVYLTGHTTDAQLRREVLGPNRQLLYKPFTTEALLAAVGVVMERGTRDAA